MSSRSDNRAAACGISKKQELLTALRCCEFNTDSIEGLRSCYSRTARRNGESARQCIAAENFADAFIHF